MMYTDYCINIYFKLWQYAAHQSEQKNSPFWSAVLSLFDDGTL